MTTERGTSLHLHAIKQQVHGLHKLFIKDQRCEPAGTYCNCCIICFICLYYGPRDSSLILNTFEEKSTGRMTVQKRSNFIDRFINI